jgi:hypothetical protein
MVDDEADGERFPLSGVQGVTEDLEGPVFGAALLVPDPAFLPAGCSCPAGLGGVTLFPLAHGERFGLVADWGAGLGHQ